MPQTYHRIKSRFLQLMVTGLFLCISQKTLGQQQNVLIKLSPFALLDDGSFPTIQPGVEVRLGERFSFYGEAAFKYRKGYYEYADTSFLPSNGYKLKSELRYYNWTGLLGWYAAANFFYMHDRHNTEIGYYYQKDSSVSLTDDFGVYKTVSGVNLLVGRQEKLSGGFLFEFYFGLGIRFRSVKNTRLEYDRNRDSFHGAMDMNIDMMRQLVDTQPGHSIAPNFTFGFRIGYPVMGR